MHYGIYFHLLPGYLWSIALRSVVGVVTHKYTLRSANHEVFMAFIFI